MQDKKERIYNTLKLVLEPVFLEIIDESYLHQGHSGFNKEGSHFFVRIKASCFENVTKVQAHRLIYQALENMIPKEIHALRIEIL